MREINSEKAVRARCISRKTKHRTKLRDTLNPLSEPMSDSRAPARGCLAGQKYGKYILTRCAPSSFRRRTKDRDTAHLFPRHTSIQDKTTTHPHLRFQGADAHERLRVRAVDGQCGLVVRQRRSRRPRPLGQHAQLNGESEGIRGRRVRGRESRQTRRGTK